MGLSKGGRLEHARCRPLDGGERRAGHIPQQPDSAGLARYTRNACAYRQQSRAGRGSVRPPRVRPPANGYQVLEKRRIGHRPYVSWSGEDDGQFVAGRDGRVAALGRSVDRAQPHRLGDLHAGLRLRHLRGHDHAAGDAAADQRMGHHPGNHGLHHDGVALGRSDRRLRLSYIGRSLRPPTDPDSDNPQLFALHRLCARPAAAVAVHLGHTRRVAGRDAGRGDHGQRNRSDKMARHSTRRTRRRLSARLHAVLANCACRRAIMGMACALLARDPARAARTLGSARHQGESPRFEHVSTEMVKEGLKKRLDIFLPVREYPREMLTATLLYFFYLFTWIGWSAWMPQYLANEKHLGFQTTASYLSIWMFCAIFAYYLCGWLCDLFGRRYVIPSFVLPAAILLVVMGYLDTPASLFWAGLVLNFLITGSFGAGLGYNTELFPTQIRGTAVGSAFTFGTAAASSAPAIVGWIATSRSIAAALPLLALSFCMIVPIFLFVARETTRKVLTDFVGQKS